MYVCLLLHSCVYSICFWHTMSHTVTCVCCCCWWWWWFFLLFFCVRALCVVVAHTQRERANESERGSEMRYMCVCLAKIIIKKNKNKLWIFIINIYHSNHRHYACATFNYYYISFFFVFVARFVSPSLEFGIVFICVMVYIWLLSFFSHFISTLLLMFFGYFFLL